MNNHIGTQMIWKAGFTSGTSGGGELGPYVSSEPGGALFIYNRSADVGGETPRGQSTLVVQWPLPGVSNDRIGEGGQITFRSLTSDAEPVQIEQAIIEAFFDASDGTSSGIKISADNLGSQQEMLKMTTLGAPHVLFCDGNIDYTVQMPMLNVLSSATMESVTATTAAFSSTRTSEENWDDLQGNSDQAAGAGGLTFQQYGTTGHSMYFMRHDQDDTLYMKFQMPHGWDTSSDVRPHIHFIPTAVPGANQVIMFGGSYTWASVGKVFNSGTTWTTWSASFTVGTGSAGKEWATTLVTVPPTGNASESDFLLMTIRRSGSDTRDTYTTSSPFGNAASNMALIGVDVHFRKVKQGTSIEFPGA